MSDKDINKLEEKIKELEAMKENYNENDVDNIETKDLKIMKIMKNYMKN
jgi:hypothetical protein